MEATITADPINRVAADQYRLAVEQAALCQGVTSPLANFGVPFYGANTIAPWGIPSQQMLGGYGLGLQGHPAQGLSGLVHPCVSCGMAPVTGGPILGNPYGQINPFVNGLNPFATHTIPSVWNNCSLTPFGLVPRVL